MGFSRVNNKVDVLKKVPFFYGNFFNPSMFPLNPGSWPRRNFSGGSSAFTATDGIPFLPTLNEMGKMVRRNNFPSQKNTALIGVQHLLPTTASLTNALIDELEVNPQNIFLAGKFYSTCEFVEKYLISRGINITSTKKPERPGQFENVMKKATKDMWDALAMRIQTGEIEKVIILDEGGYCRETIPNWILYEIPCAAIEQTRYGFYSKVDEMQPMPTVDVARSAAKRELESRVIIEAVIRSANQLISTLNLNKKAVFGVVGNGAIGSALVNFLLSKNYKVVVYDNDKNAFRNVNMTNCFRSETLEMLLNTADFVFGCSGREATKKIKVSQLLKSVTLASCSSQQIEFENFMTGSARHPISLNEVNGFSFLTVRNKHNAEITIAAEGYPINFTRTPDSDPPLDMLLTRMLLQGAFMQAVGLARMPVGDGFTPNKGNNIHMLNPTLQQWCAKQWKEFQPPGRFKPEELSNFEDIGWIERHSNGTQSRDAMLENAFSVAQEASPANTSRFKP